MSYAIYIKETKNSPKIVIDFPKLLFEISGVSTLENPLLFYQPIFNYISADFYQIKDSIYQRNTTSITLHFYLKYAGMQDVEMIREIDRLFFQIKEFTTYIYWHYNPYNPESVELANDIKNTFLNYVRLIEDNVHT